MDITIIGLVITLAVLVMNNEVPYNAIKLFEKSYSDALSVLLDAKKCGEITEENYYIMVNKMGDRSINVDKDIIKINNVKRFLPILLAIEVEIVGKVLDFC